MPAHQNGLTPKQAKFVDRFLVHQNGTRAAIEAGYSEKYASDLAYQNLQKPVIKQMVRDRQRALAEQNSVDQQRVIQEYARIAFADPRKMFNQNDELVPLTHLDDDTAAAVQSLDVESGKKAPVRVKFASKVAALDSLSKHLGIFSHSEDEEGPAQVIVKQYYVKVDSHGND